MTYTVHMIRTQVYLHDQQYHLAKLLAAQEDAAFSEAIREGLDMWIQAKQKSQDKKNNRRAFDGFIGSIKAIPTEPNMQVDDIYNDVLPWDRQDWQKP